MRYVFGVSSSHGLQRTTEKRCIIKQGREKQETKDVPDATYFARIVVAAHGRHPDTSARVLSYPRRPE